eukprot:jgi/Chlat1/4324/Chrsp29S00344
MVVASSPSWAALLPLLGLDVAVQAVGWVVSACLRTERFFDATGAATFLALALLSIPRSSHPPPHPRQLLLAGLVAVWAVRLGAFLAARVNSRDSGFRDSRFDGVRDSPRRLAAFWAVQAVWVALTLMPVLLANAVYTPDLHPPLGKLDAAGAAVWAVGFGLEAVADAQKTAWRRRRRQRQEAGEGEAEGEVGFIRSGVWSWSRHPNYAGEIALWWGVWLVAACGGALPPAVAVAAAAAGPLFVTLLIVFVSGVPMLERAADERFGADPAYLAYKAATPMLIPCPPALRKLLRLGHAEKDHFS